MTPGAFRSRGSSRVSPATPPFPSRGSPSGSITRPNTPSPTCREAILRVRRTWCPSSTTFDEPKSTIPTLSSSRFSTIPRTGLPSASQQPGLIYHPRLAEKRYYEFVVPGVPLLQLSTNQKVRSRHYPLQGSVPFPARDFHRCRSNREVRQVLLLALWTARIPGQYRPQPVVLFLHHRLRLLLQSPRVVSVKSPILRQALLDSLYILQFLNSGQGESIPELV